MIKKMSFRKKKPNLNKKDKQKPENYKKDKKNMNKKKSTRNRRNFTMRRWTSSLWNIFCMIDRTKIMKAYRKRTLLKYRFSEG